MLLHSERVQKARGVRSVKDGKIARTLTVKQGAHERHHRVKAYPLPYICENRNQLLSVPPVPVIIQEFFAYGQNA
ncbi:MAG: hypothetical protein GY820_47895 [Gammaproteobacteria bacterium]|nr:hypothetical protein [Gammaproteobacteria bacterium]